MQRSFVFFKDYFLFVTLSDPNAAFVLHLHDYLFAFGTGYHANFLGKPLDYGI